MERVRVRARAVRAADDLDEVVFERERPARLLALDRDAAPKLRERPRGDEASLRNDRDVRAQPLDYLKHVRREEDRQAPRRQTREQVLQRARGDGVNALERLIKE